MTVIVLHTRFLIAAGECPELPFARKCNLLFENLDRPDYVIALVDIKTAGGGIFRDVVDIEQMPIFDKDLGPALAVEVEADPFDLGGRDASAFCTASLFFSFVGVHDCKGRITDVHNSIIHGTLHGDEIIVTGLKR
jgi:hypothetical protein